MESVAKTYAKALLLLSIENDDSKEILDEIKLIEDGLKANPEFIKILDSKSLTKDDKKTLIKNVFEAKINKQLFNFMQLLIDKGRIRYLKDICKDYKKLYYKHFNIKEAIIYSAKPLDQKRIDLIKDSLQKKYQEDFMVENEVDTSLIAGIKVVIGDLVIDGSIKNKLDRMQESITL